MGRRPFWTRNLLGGVLGGVVGLALYLIFDLPFVVGQWLSGGLTLLGVYLVAEWQFYRFAREFERESRRQLGEFRERWHG